MQILVADDHELVRTGVRLVLETHPGWRVCAEARDGAEAVALAAQWKPDVAVVDLVMPVMDGVEAIRRIRAASPATAVLVMTGHGDGGMAETARSAGACGYLLKSGQSASLIEAIQSVAARSRAPESLAEAAPEPAGNALPARRPQPLTPREIEIARLLAEGKTNWVVAQILGISVKTVETHRGNVMRKLGLESVVELVHYAVRTRLVTV